MIHCNFVGHLTDQAKSQSVGNGDKNLVNFRMAVKSGKTDTVWVDASYWGSAGQSVLPYLTKGKKVYIVGTCTPSSYVNKDNSTVNVMKVNVNNLELLSTNEASEKSDIPF